MNFLPEMNFSETAEELSVSSRSASSRPLISPCMHFNMSASPLGLPSGPLLAANLLYLHGFPDNLISTIMPLAFPYSMPALPSALSMASSTIPVFDGRSSNQASHLPSGMISGLDFQNSGLLFFYPSSPSSRSMLTTSFGLFSCPLLGANLLNFPDNLISTTVPLASPYLPTAHSMASTTVSVVDGRSSHRARKQGMYSCRYNYPLQTMLGFTQWKPDFYQGWKGVKLNGP